MLLTLLGLETAGATLTTWFTGWIDALFAPARAPDDHPAAGAVRAARRGRHPASVRSSVSYVRDPLRRRSRSSLLWRLLGAPLSSERLVARCAAELWNLIRGAAPLAAPARIELARKYVELLTENLGQPGFRELLVTAHDMDARRDVVFALLAPTHRGRFFSRAASEPGTRGIEAFDLSGVARDHALDALEGALAVPLATEPHLVRFSSEGPWRGEAHRLCDRPEGLSRLIEEAAAAGAEQVILVSASPTPGAGARAECRTLRPARPRRRAARRLRDRVAA